MKKSNKSRTIRQRLAEQHLIDQRLEQDERAAELRNMLFDEPKQMKVTLTPRQRSLLIMDVVSVGPDPHADEKTRAAETLLIDELKAGNVITITDFVEESVEEFADRDADPDEQRTYKNLIRKIQNEGCAK